MAYSQVNATGDGSTTTFSVVFALGYINESDVTCQVNNEIDGAGNPIYRAITFVTPTMAQIAGAAPANGVPVVFRRTVPKDELLVDFEDGDSINSENLSLSSKQSLMAVQELLDNRVEARDTDLSVDGFKVTNVADATDDTDAVNKRTVVALTAAPLLQIAGYATQAGTSASAAQTAMGQAVQAVTDAHAQVQAAADQVALAQGKVQDAAAEVTAAHSEAVAAQTAATQAETTKTQVQAIADTVANSTDPARIKTPFDFLDPTLHDAVRTGVNAPHTNAAIQALIDDMIATAGDTGGSVRIPAGTWILNKPIRATFNTGAANRNLVFSIDVDPAAKLVPSATNKYRFKIMNQWDAATQPFAPSNPQVGDAFRCISGKTGITGLGSVVSVNTGDIVYLGTNGWQKILFEANYHKSRFNAATNLDIEGNQIIAADEGEEGDVYIVSVAGTWNGITLAIGDELVYTAGAWRRKTGQLPAFQNKGAWDAGNALGLNNTNGNTGDWYTVTGDYNYAPVPLGGGYSTGLGSHITYKVGDKIYCLRPGHWVKMFWSPTPWGVFEKNGTVLRQWYPSSVPAGYTGGSVVPADLAYEPLDDLVPYGTLAVTQNTDRGDLQGTTLYRGPLGWETLPLDPNYDVGLFHFYHDDRTVLKWTGKINVVTHQNGITEQENSQGWAMRFHNLARPNYGNYLYSGRMLHIEDITSGCDDTNSANAQFYAGSWEGMIEVRNMYLPNIEQANFQFTLQDGAARKASMDTFPRWQRFGVRHIDSYVPRHDSMGGNGGVQTLLSIESEVWDAEMPSYEGGYAFCQGAAVVDMFSMRHGIRYTQDLGEPTFNLKMGDTNAQRYTARIHGTTGILVEVGVPILPNGAGGSFPINARPSFLYIEDADNIRVQNGTPTASFYTDDSHYSSLIRTKGQVTGVSLSNIHVGEMDGKGVLLDLHHNSGGNGRDALITIHDIEGWKGDTPTMKLVRGRADLIQGVTQPVKDTFLKGLVTGGEGSNIATGFGDTGDTVIQHGLGRMTSGMVYLDFYNDPGQPMRARLLRTPGPDGELHLQNTGNGNFFLQADAEVLLQASKAYGVDFESVESTVATTAGIELGAIPTLRVALSGAGTVSNFGTIPNKYRIVRCTGATTIVHDATRLFCIGRTNISLGAGDTFTIASDASGNWRMLSVQRNNEFAAWAQSTGNMYAGDTTTVIGSYTLRQRVVGKTVDYAYIANVTSPAGGGSVMLPLPVQAGPNFYMAVGRNTVDGRILQGFIAPNSTWMGINFGDNTYPGASVTGLVLSGTYETV